MILDTISNASLYAPLHEGIATAIHLTAGSFVVLLPQDAHAPACMVQTSQNVKKIIAKVRV